MTENETWTGVVRAVAVLDEDLHTGERGKHFRLENPVNLNEVREVAVICKRWMDFDNLWRVAPRESLDVSRKFLRPLFGLPELRYTAPLSIQNSLKPLDSLGFKRSGSVAELGVQRVIPFYRLRSDVKMSGDFRNRRVDAGWVMAAVVLDRNQAVHNAHLTLETLYHKFPKGKQGHESD